MNDSGKTPALVQILSACDEYQESLARLYWRLDISECYVGRPELLVAGLIVAELIGGVALPLESEFSRFAEVISREGERVRVYAVSDLYLFDGFIEAEDRDGWDLLAIVAFVKARPVMAHVIPRGRIRSVAEAFGRSGLSRGHVAISMFLHCNLDLEPVIAAALGVRSYSLVSDATSNSKE